MEVEIIKRQTGTVRVVV